MDPTRALSTSSSRVRATWAGPVASAITMQDINVMSDALGPEFQEMRINEKEELKTLNTRFAGYIQKVSKSMSLKVFEKISTKVWEKLYMNYCNTEQ